MAKSWTSGATHLRAARLTFHKFRLLVGHECGPEPISFSKMMFDEKVTCSTDQNATEAPSIKLCGSIGTATSYRPLSLTLTICPSSCVSRSTVDHRVDTYLPPKHLDVKKGPRFLVAGIKKKTYTHQSDLLLASWVGRIAVVEIVKGVAGFTRTERGTDLTRRGVQ